MLPTKLHARVFRLLDADDPPREILIEVVRVVDTAFLEPRRRQAVQDVIARMVVALGEELQAMRSSGIEATTEAARAYLASPSSDSWGGLFAAATMTYPFGPGDGCLALDELGGHGARGAGCASGVGFIATTGLADERVVAILRRALGGDDDT